MSFDGAQPAYSGNSTWTYSSGTDHAEPQYQFAAAAANATSAGAGGAGFFPTGPTTEPSLAGNEKKLLPVANIGRIMKRALPDNVKVTKEAKTACRIAVSEFIGLVTAEASDRMVVDSRRTITGTDLLDALRALGYIEYMQDLEPLISTLRAKKALNQ